jgi:hypothetical protein
LSSGKKLVLVLALGLMGPAGVLALAVATSTPIPSLVRDPPAVFGSGPQIGFLSTIGVTLWSAAATVCLLASWVTHGESRRFFLWSGLGSLLLMLDDALMLHDFVAPYVLPLPGHVLERAIYLAYFLLLVAYLTRFFRHIILTNYVYLGAALIAFAASLLIDLAREIFLSGMESLILLEDGFKFLGIVLWLSYFAGTAATSMGHRK